ncbi:LytR C-terminal domain-containing protein [Actinacidiphila acididurans]|uniref:LCP family protein n=1 Tax=Actinacidiphila acididurans TaxID=2784346 RepID=A0ABS2TYA1_9ACTN|nr:LCP family protein [Actinacidiphila acididurans]MBM9508315.1 LCP family protein [Actinacidiphila acididurans]
MNDANPRWHYAESGNDDEPDPYPQDPYYQQQHYGYDAYGRPLPPPPPGGGQVPGQQGQDGQPYYQDSGQSYGGHPQQQNWIPQQPQQPYYEQGYGTGQPSAYDTGQHTAYDPGRQAPGPGTGQYPGYDTGRQPQYDTGQQPLYDTGQHAVYDTGQHTAVHDTGGHPVYETAQQQAVHEQEPAPNYHTEQFAFVDEESEESEEVIDWLKFSESRTERREEARRRSRNRKVGLVVVLVLALLGGGGYLWQAGRIPGLGKDKKAAAAAAGGAQKRDVIVVHLLPVSGGPSATALLVDNTTKGRGTTVLIPNSLALSADDGSPTTLASSVADGVGPTRDSLNALLGADIKGSWRLDSPYLELLVDSLGDIYVDTNAAVKGTGKDSGKTLVAKGSQTELTGQAAVAYATYRAPGEPQTAQLARFGQVMQGVLKKMPSDALDATKTVQSLAQILDPSLTDKELGASLGQLAELAKTGAYTTTMLPVQKDGTVSAQATADVVKNVLGGALGKQGPGASAQPRVAVTDKSGKAKAGAMAQAAIVNGGTYTYVPGAKATTTRATSEVLYSDPARLAAAKDVAATLGLPAGSVQKGTVPSNADISVVLGRDYQLPAQQ